MFHACSLETKQLAQGDSQEGVVKARRARSGPAFSAASLWLTLDLFGGPPGMYWRALRRGPRISCVFCKVWRGVFRNRVGAQRSVTRPGVTSQKSPVPGPGEWVGVARRR